MGMHGHDVHIMSEVARISSVLGVLSQSLIPGDLGGRVVGSVDVVMIESHVLEILILDRSRGAATLRRSVVRRCRGRGCGRRGGLGLLMLGSNCDNNNGCCGLRLLSRRVLVRGMRTSLHVAGCGRRGVSGDGDGVVFYHDLSLHGPLLNRASHRQYSASGRDKD